MDSIEFGKYLKKIRENANLSMGKLAKASEVSQPYLSQIENGQRGIPSPDILNKLSGPLGVHYEELMFKADYWKERYTKEDKNLFQEIHNDHWNALNQITAILKAFADDDGIFPNYLHRDLFQIIGEWLPAQENDQHNFDKWFIEFQNRTEDKIGASDIDDMHNEFNKIYNYTTVKNGFQQYNLMSKDLDDFLNELINLAKKHDISFNEPTNNSIPVIYELSTFLEQPNITYKSQFLNEEDRKSILDMLAVLFRDKK